MDKDRSPVYLVRHPISFGRLAGVLGSSMWAAGPCPLPTEFSELSPELSVFTTPTHRATLEVQQLTLPMCVQLLSHILFLALFFSFLSFCFPPPPRVKRGLTLELRLSLNPWSSSCLRRLSVVGLQAYATHSAAALLVSVFLSQPAFLFFGESLHALVKLSSFLPCRLWDVAFCLTSLTVFSSLPLNFLGVGS